MHYHYFSSPHSPLTEARFELAKHTQGILSASPLTTRELCRFPPHSSTFYLFLIIKRYYYNYIAFIYDRGAYLEIFSLKIFKVIPLPPLRSRDHPSGLPSSCNRAVLRCVSRNEFGGMERHSTLRRLYCSRCFHLCNAKICLGAPPFNK